MQVITMRRAMEVLIIALVLLTSSQQLLAQGTNSTQPQSSTTPPPSTAASSTASPTSPSAPSSTTPAAVASSSSPPPTTVAPASTTTLQAAPATVPTPASQVHHHPSEPPKMAAIDGVFDLSHPLDNSTLHWPTNTGFTHTITSQGERLNPKNESYYLKSDSFTMAIHSGTHLDAPSHFNSDGWNVDQIPLDRLINVPLQVIDLSAKVKANRSYEFAREDFVGPKPDEPLVKPKSVVLVYTGISLDYAQGAKAYFGTDSKDISQMIIPGFSRDAAQYLADLGVFGVGLDAPSADGSFRHGPDAAYDPVAHSIFTKKNIYILENVSNKLSDLLKEQADIRHCLRLTAIPLPIVGGSGSPVRLIATTQAIGADNLSVKNSALENMSPSGFGKTLTSLIMIAAILLV